MLKRAIQRAARWIASRDVFWIPFHKLTQPLHKISPCYKFKIRVLALRDQFFFYRWLNKVLPPDGTAVKAGFTFEGGSSFLETLAQRLDGNGTLVGIEPTRSNLEKAKQVLARYPCNFSLHEKVLLSTKLKAQLLLGASDSWNRVEQIPDSENWGTSKVTKSGREMAFTGDKLNIEAESLDNILLNSNIAYDRVDFLDLTINGAEFEALKGSQQLLGKSKNMAVSVIVGRQAEGKIGYIGEAPDHEVIASLLQSLGFTCFKFSHTGDWGLFGYLYAWKGDKPAFTDVLN